MFFSAFELLVKPIAPPPFDPAVSRRVVQAYFLTLSNLNPPGEADVALSIQFTPTPDLNNDELIAITDVGAGNVFSDLVPDPVTGKPSQALTLPSGKTALFVLQPDLSKAPPNRASLAVANLEVRGYVELTLSPYSPTRNAEILVTPQHRGTFLPAAPILPFADFDQQSYPLQTANPGGVIKFTM